MASKSFDTTEILFTHIELVTARLDQIGNIATNNVFSNSLKSKYGQESISFAKNYVKSSDNKNTTKINGNVKKFINENKDKLTIIYQDCGYIIDWARHTRANLINLCANSVELDIRWNYLFTFRFCSLFNALTKVILFFYKFKELNYISILGSLTDTQQKPNFDAIGIYKFISSCAVSPFNMLKTDDDLFPKHLGQLVSQVGPFFLQSIGQWPLLDWQDFVPFNKVTTQLNESTLPNLEHIILANLKPLIDTVLFFLLAFPHFVKKYKQFKALMLELFSEQRVIYVSREFSLDFKEVYKPNDLNKLSYEQIDYQLSIKEKLSHNQRIKFLLILLRDIGNVAKFNPSYVPQLIHDIVGLSSFAAYELSIVFQNENSITKESIQLLEQLVQLCKLFLTYSDHFSRFFIFNIGSINCSYLSQLHQQFSSGGLPWQKSFSAYLGDLLYDLQTAVDLEEFDKGKRFDCTPFLYTHGRFVHFFNILKKTKRVAYYQPVLEHLETIRYHIEFAQSPIKAFLNHCPIHTIWKFAKQFANYIKEGKSEKLAFSVIVELFAMFNMDVVSLSINDNVIQGLKKYITSIRADIMTQLNKILNDYLTESPFTKIVQQNRFKSLFDPIPFIHNIQYFDIEQIEKNAIFNEKIWEMKLLMNHIPDAIDFGDAPIKFKPYIADNFSNNTNRILFQRSDFDPYTIDSIFITAAQIIWPLYTILGVSFPKKMYLVKYENSCIDNHYKFLDLVAKIKTGEASNQTDELGFTNTIIQNIKISLHKFLQEGCFNSLFLIHSKRFTSESASILFSQNAFEYLISNLGIYAAYEIDNILITYISQTMVTIFNDYTTLTKGELNNWLQDFRTGGSKWFEAFNKPEIQKSAKEMIRLGSLLVIRDMLRSAIYNVTEKAIPGFSTLIKTFYKTNEISSEKESLFIELFTTLPYYHFIEISIRNHNIQKTTDAIQFFFYLSLLLGSPEWQDVIYSPENEAITKNLHLFPIAMNIIINMFNNFSVSCDFHIIVEGMQFFFDVYQHIIMKYRNMQNISNETVNTFIILVDSFPRYINNIEYGRTTFSFPTSIITNAYRIMEINKEKYNIDNNKTGKGKKRSKR